MSRSVRKGGWRSLALAGLAAVCGGCSAARLAGGSGSALACTCGRVTALTSGPGNDTEAAWSPDGTRVAFQTDAAGDLDIAAVEVGSRRQSTLVGGAGNACYPAWAPGGGLVYSFGNLRETAMQAASRGSSEGYGLRIWEAAGSRILTQGLWRDYTPCVARDGKAVYFASTRDSVENSASLWRLSLDSGATAERVVSVDGASVGAAQPSLSRDGRYIVWAQLDGFRQNWRLYAARVANPQEAVCLTPGEMSAYAPRWSPDGRVIAFTGFCAGDPGWGVFLLEPCSGCRVRLETGPGNSRSPDWSPDGRELVFENNRGGLYKLYRMPVSVRVTSEHEAHASVALVPPREEARLVRSGGEVAREPFYLHVWYRECQVERDFNEKIFAWYEREHALRQAGVGAGKVHSLDMGQYHACARKGFKDDIYIWLRHEPEKKPYRE